MSAVEVKICGLRDAAGVRAAAEAGADLVGFVFWPRSPRAVTPEEAARASAAAPGPDEGGPLRVGLFVDAGDAEIAGALAAVPLDLLQLHGAEPPARVAEVRARFGVPVMRAIPVAAAADLDALDAYAPHADRFLLDARPPPGAALPGGNGAAFDWSLVAGRDVPRPWLLAGGLTPGNVARAVAESGARGVDVSSGVERARGEKDAALVAAFVAAARGAEGRGRAG